MTTSDIWQVSYSGYPERSTVAGTRIPLPVTVSGGTVAIMGMGATFRMPAVIQKVLESISHCSHYWPKALISCGIQGFLQAIHHPPSTPHCSTTIRSHKAQATFASMQFIVEESETRILDSVEKNRHNADILTNTPCNG